MTRATIITFVITAGCSHPQQTAQPTACPPPLVTTAPAPSPTPPPPAPAPPPMDTSHRAPEMAQSDFFVGTWDCDVHRLPGPLGEKRYKGTIVVTQELDGNWTAIHNTSDEASVAGFSGWDGVAKKFVRVAFDSKGGIEKKWSTGWNGDTWVFQGTASVMAAGKEVPLRHTLTRKGSGEFSGKYELQFGPQWVTIRDETCKKR